jgi:predicted nucleic acid-binding protein
MQLYLETSALVKLIVIERETSALRTYLREFADDVRFTAALTRTELLRAVRRSGSSELAGHAHRVLGRLDLITLTNRLLDEAGSIGPPELRTLDAIHLAAARTAPALRGFITYDLRLAAAAEAVGVRVASPR